MTDIVNIPDLLPISQYPALGSANFNQEAYDYATSVPPAVSRMREVAVACRTCAIAAREQADAAMGYRNQAANSAAAAEAAKAIAQAAASSAETAKNQAQSAATSAAISAQAVDQYMLGPKTVPPTADNQGGVIKLGAMYINIGTDPNLNNRWFWWGGNVLRWVPGVGDLPATFMPRGGGIFTGHIEVPQGAAGSQAPRASEVTSRTTASFDHTTPMSEAPYNQWSFFTSGVQPGSDWPPGHSSTNAWNVITCGFATRATQYATQDIDIGAGLQGWTFTRSLHDTTWSPWSRVVTDTSFIERVVTATASGGTYAPDPKSGTVHQVTVTAACTISPVAPRLGDQLTVKVQFSGGAWPLTFAASVKPPTGSAPTYAAGQILPLIFECSRAGIWDLSYGQVRAV